MPSPRHGFALAVVFGPGLLQYFCIKLLPASCGFNQM